MPIFLHPAMDASLLKPPPWLSAKLPTSGPQVLDSSCSEMNGLPSGALPPEDWRKNMKNRDFSESRQSQCAVAPSSQAAKRKKIWIDLDNTPHVPFFEPIIHELEQRGYSVLISARDAFQVLDLAKTKGMEVIKIGKHYGKHRLFKLFGLAYRSLQCVPHALQYRPSLAISHGSRSQILLCGLLRIPSVLLFDYEHVGHLPFVHPTYMIGPEIVPANPKSSAKSIHMYYPGLKENVYACNFRPDPEFLPHLNIDGRKILVTVRPPATEAHYHRPESEVLFVELMDRLYRVPEVTIVLLPRNRVQGSEITSRHKQWFEGRKTVIPEKALDGMNLIWHSDLVVSGGGTMNREAAALGVPVYSIFRGTIGAVDEHLARSGKLILLESVQDLDRKLVIERRERRQCALAEMSRTLQVILGHIERIFRMYESGEKPHSPLGGISHSPASIPGSQGSR
jgi:predicted glycosyltransferase